MDWFNFYYLGVALFHLVVAGYSLRLFLRTRKSYTVLLIVTVLALVYDNAVIGLGSMIGEGEFLQNLNLGRYIGHQTLTPMMIIFAFGMARLYGLGWAQGKLAHAIFCLLATLTIGLGWWQDVINYTMIPELEMGTLRYINDTPNIKGPPLAAIIPIIVMIVVGIMIWRKNGWSWLAVGSIVMFIAAGAGVGVPGLTNFGEVVFTASLAATDNKAHSLNASA